MKKICVILFSLIISIAAMAQWQQQNSGTSLDLYSVHFVSSNTGFAVGDLGIILKTINGGINWVSLNSGTDQRLYSVFFIDALIGFCVGDSGTILKTADGGQIWNLHLLDSNITLRSIHFPNESNGFIAAERTIRPAPYQIIYDAIIVRTEDCGENWNYSVVRSGLLGSICFPSADTGYAGGSLPGTPGYIFSLKTIDGGDNWTYINDAGYVKCFTDIDTGYALSPLKRTYDGGANWESCTFTIDWSIGSIYFLDNGVGYGIGYNMDYGNAIIKSIDYGDIWTIQDSFMMSEPIEIFFPVADTGYIVGSDGLILKTTNGGAPSSILEIFPYAFYVNIFPNPVQSILHIELSKQNLKNTSLSIYNLNGQQLITQPLTELQTEIDISHLPNGIYIVKVWSDQDVMVRKVIKQ